jgi:hypothetical protein
MKALSDDVLRKIGRNVMLFQRAEGLLKTLVANHHMDGTTNDLVERQQRRAEKVQKDMMGLLIKQYIDGILSDADKPPKEPQDDKQERISVTFKTVGNGDFYGSQRAGLEQMVGERNDLIHHFLPRLNIDSLEHMTAAASYLDQQHEKVLPMFEHLKSVAKSMLLLREGAAMIVASDEYGNLLGYRVILKLLVEATTQKARPDGWTYLADAGRMARIREPDEVAHMKERYGYSTLKQLLIASELFDVLVEPLPNGNSHILYRAKKTLNH